MPTSEIHLIQRIRKLAGSRAGSAIRKGIGDDCAVLRMAPGSETLVTTDLSLEGVHFRRDWHSPDSVGHRCLARGLSDLASMGGDPVAAFLSIALPREVEQAWIDSFLNGFLKLARRHGVTLAGGDLAESSQGICADIVCLGSVPAGKAVMRSGARAGDGIYVTGELGRSAMILHALRDGRKISPKSKDAARHFYPEPRIKLGQALRGIASAMIDLSDGLSTDLTHICQESRVGALVAEHSIPRGISFQGSSLHYALHGGEDYELLFTAPKSARVPAKIAGIRITRIGEVIADRKHRIFLTDSHGQRKELIARGWEHFRN